MAIASVFLLLTALTLTAGQQAWYGAGVAGMLIAFSLLIAFGSYSIRFNYFIRSVNHAKPGVAGITLTFDDGPDEHYTLQIADLLDREGIKATFFVIGHKAEKHPHIVKELHARGHVIANHSYSHNKNIPAFGTKRLKNDLARCSETIGKITGEQVRWFRPPFGVTTPRYARALASLKLVCIGWSLRSMDTVTADASRLLLRVTKKLKPGTIVLFHDTQKVTLLILPQLLEYCRTNGIKIVSLQESTDLKPYGHV